MNCPLCIDEVLDVTHRGGIEVDVCPRCRGVWLDRGELDRLVAETGPAVAAESSAPLRSARDDDGGKGSKKSKKRRLTERLGDVFEDVLDF
ncbi:MAG: zf-TFIIB domain-containing protein [Acidimicrobiales bacterium]|nr:zf-TFIIB domain-containing protein [Acidimicrobiales bacterium]